MTTKQQEREALAKIRKIVEGLGEDSYIGTALDGCLEIAEENIDNDFACSMKQRADGWEKKSEELFSQILDLKEELHLANEKAIITEKNAKTAAEAKDAEIARLREELAEANRKALSPDLFKSLYRMFIEDAERATEEMASAAESMADFADTPADIAFTEAVRQYKFWKMQLANCREILVELDKRTPRGC